MTLRELISFCKDKANKAEDEAATGAHWCPICQAYIAGAVAYRETIEHLARLEGLEK